MNSRVDKRLGKIKKGLNASADFMGYDLLFNLFRTIVAIVIAMFISAIIIFIVSENPWYTLRVFLISPFEDHHATGEIITRAVPLIFTGLAASVMLRAGQFNLFGEGAFFIGGFVGALGALHFKLPVFMLPWVALLAAALMAGILGSVPAFLKAKLGVSEFVVSLMMNFIVLWVGLYFLGNVFNDLAAGDITTHIIPEQGRLALISDRYYVNQGIIIAMVMVVFTYVLFNYTRFGYNIKVVGDNATFARYSGINPVYPIFYAQVIGASIAGIGGATEVLGNYTRFNWKSLPGFGFDGFMIAIIAKNNPIAIFVVALFFGYIRTGAMQMEIFTDVSREIVTIIQAIIILLVAAQAFLMSLHKKIMIRKVQALNEKIGVVT